VLVKFNVNSLILTVRKLKFKSLLCHLTALWPYAFCFHPLSLFSQLSNADHKNLCPFHFGEVVKWYNYFKSNFKCEEKHK
jgi:hypothetical protein